VKYLSVCSGIEAATVAWHPLGWEAFAYSEIEKFPCQVLAHHYPDTPNLGDMTKFQEWPDAAIDVLVGGTPCQSFSIAGLREGLSDPRGNLMLTYLAIAAKYLPKWLVWENVPGVLSSNGGNDFASLLRGMAELGYGFSYRVLDAQYFGVAQRRRRVFVVGCLRDWRSAAAVLFERDSLSGNPAPSRKTRKDVTEIAGTLTSNCGGLDRPAGNANELDFCVTTFDRQSSGEYGTSPISSTVSARDYKSPSDLIAMPIAFDLVQITSKTNRSRAEPGLPASTISKNSNMHVAHTFKIRGGCEGGGKGYLGSDDMTFTITANDDQHLMTPSMQVRRLTPTECERLQGFPDGYTDIRENTPDGPRYKALGNSMAVPVMEWIGRRIQAVESIQKERVAA
jgi:DNA (cytosine-5)-methyltransferase 1